jgi:hypothetical protein
MVQNHQKSPKIYKSIVWYHPKTPSFWRDGPGETVVSTPGSGWSNYIKFDILGLTKFADL